MTTRYLPLAHHHVTGVTLTDTALRFMMLTQHGHNVLPERYGEAMVPEGCLNNGKIVDRTRFVSFLKNVRKAHAFHDIHLVLDCAQIQTLSVSVKGAAPLYIREAVEKEFGLAAKDIIYEYKAIGGKEDMTVFQVTAMPKSLSQEFVSAFKSAGITILSIEPIGYALGRDLLPVVSHHSVMIVNIDTVVSSLTFVINNRVAQTIHFTFGDLVFTEAIIRATGVSREEAERLKQDQGLLVESRTVFNAVVDDCVALVRHINDAYISWRTAHPALPPLDMIYLTGAGSLLRGLDEYISTGLRVTVQQGNVWANCFSFDDHIPAIPQTAAVLYGPAIGVALVGSHMINLLRYGHQRSLRRKHAAKISGKILLSFLLGMIVGFAVARAMAVPGVHAWVLTMLHKIQARW